ncbi:hypothetical protein M434DRAFT_386644 [Hypoxylon sp. CO27-5]|nr:hypothetical protein M434DRAFT_386644 [Hypoxylon sp. CO27-5]
MDNSIDSSLVSTADRETQPVASENPRLHVKPQSSKRNQITDDENLNTKRPKYQWSLPATPSSSPFQTLRVTKSRNISSHSSLSKTEENTPSDHDALNNEVTGTQCLLEQTPMGQLTPHPTGRDQQYENEPNHKTVVESANGLYEISSPFFDENDNSVPVTFPDAPVTIDSSQNLSHANLAATTAIELPTNSKYLTVLDDGRLWQNTSDAGELAKKPAKSVNLNLSVDINLEDEYPLGDDLMEEDITCLLDTAMNNVRETHIPPSSVTIAWDHDSRSAVEYDPTLQHSSPLSLENSGVSQLVIVSEKLNSSQDDLLDEEVDWDAVYAMASIAPGDRSSAGHQEMVPPPLGDGITYMEKPTKHNLSIKDGATPLKPFVRPPFPAKVRDRSIISGVSSDTMLRTCFRTGEMINQAAYCLNHRQEVVFELFARVTYSSRESLQRRQHFQFIDLFKDQRPYPVGILSDWRVGSQLDRQSSTFLGTSAEPRICRCVCKPVRDAKIAIGFSLVVLAIREIDWMQIKWAKKIVCGGSDDVAQS